MRILIRSIFPDTLREIFNRNSSSAPKLTNDNGLGVNGEKTQWYRKEIQVSDKAKYLGGVIDKKLNWKLNLIEIRFL